MLGRKLGKLVFDSKPQADNYVLTRQARRDWYITTPKMKPSFNNMSFLDQRCISRRHDKERLRVFWWYAYFHHHSDDKILCFLPELLVHCQVDEEVADVVDVVSINYQADCADVVDVQRQRHKADDVDERYQD